MSFFFKSHPLVAYDPTGKKQPVLAIDITRRFRLERVTRNNKLVFYDYIIKERDRPDIMANLYYKDPRLDWIFFITNELFDPYFQWPLTYLQFNEYIRQKYGSVAVAKETSHHYEQILQARKEKFEFNGEIINVPEKTVWVDQTTYSSLSPSVRKSIDSFTFEENENNRKQHIKILDKAFIPSIMQEFSTIFKAA